MEGFIETIEGYGWIQLNLAGFNSIQLHLAGFSWIQLDLAGFRRIQKDSDIKFPSIWYVWYGMYGMYGMVWYGMYGMHNVIKVHIPYHFDTRVCSDAHLRGATRQFDRIPL